MMWCDETASVIYTQLSQREVGEKFRAEEIQRVLQNAATVMSRKQAFARVPEAVKDYHSVLSHELDHLRRQFATSSGFLRLHLQSLLVSACQELIVSCQLGNIDIPFPLMERWNLRKTRPELFTDCLTLLSRWGEEIRSISAAIKALVASAGVWGLEGGTSLQDRTLADAAMWLVVRGENFAPIGAGRRDCLPEIDEWLGATQLYEHMGMLQELSCRTQLGGDMAEWRVLVEADIRYSTIMRLWHQFFPEGMPNGKASMRPGDVITDIYRAYPVEFYAALDLSLWIPLGPYGLAGSGRVMCWEDVQPGHRFLTALSALKNSGWSLTPVTSDDRERRFDETQRWLAERLGWRSPQELAVEWHDYLARGQWYDDGFIIGCRESPVMRMATTILGRRIQNAFDVVCSNVRWPDGDSPRFAVWMTDEGDRGCRMHALVDNQAGDLTRDSYYLFRGCQVLLFGETSYIDRLDIEHRKEAINVLSRDLACESWDEEYFRETGGDFLSVDQ